MKIFQANSCLWPVVLITTLCDKFINNLKSPGFLQVTLFSYNKIEILSKVELNTHTVILKETWCLDEISNFNIIILLFAFLLLKKFRSCLILALIAV